MKGLRNIQEAGPLNLIESLSFIGQTSAILTLSVIGYIMLRIIKAKNKKEIQHLSLLSGLFLYSSVSIAFLGVIPYFGTTYPLFATNLFLMLATFSTLHGLNIRSGKFPKIPILSTAILSIAVSMISTFTLYDDFNARVGIMFFVLVGILIPSILAVPIESDNPSKKEKCTQKVIGLSVLVSTIAVFISIAPPGSLSINILMLMTAAVLMPLYYSTIALVVYDLTGAAHTRSITDITTGSFNRRYMNNELRQIMQKGKNNKIPLRFMIISIDSFKSLNREFGFKATDEILSELAFSISSSINEDSPVIHIGGDEFLVALIDVERKTINDIVNEIRSSVEQIRISYTKENLGISIQCGLATYDNTESLESLITRAELDLKTTH